MKRLLIIPAILFVLLALALIAPNFIDWNQYKDQAMTQIKQASGLDVQINGNISMALLPTPHVSIADVVVKNPAETGESAQIAVLQRLDVHVGLISLFNKEINVQAVRLVEPDIRIYKSSEGRFSFMTPQLEAMMAAGKDAKPAGGQKDLKIAFEDVSIDNGALFYADAAQKQPIILKGVSFDIAAKTLQGPFNIDGTLNYNGQVAVLAGKIGAYDTKAQSASLNLGGEYAGMKLSYAGLVAGGEQPEIQGETTIAIASLAEFLRNNGGTPPAELKGGLELQGFLSANAQNAALKDATLTLAGQELEGSFTAGFKPISMEGKFQAKEPINLDPFMKAKPAANAQGFDPAALGVALPKTLELPEMGAVNIELSGPGLIYNSQLLRDVRLVMSKSDKGFKAQIAAADMPGKGPVQAEAALSFAEKSKSSKTGTEIYSGPSAAFALKGQSQNMPMSVEAFTGLRDLPLIKDARSGAFDFAGRVTPVGVSLSKGVLQLGDASFAVSGAMSGQTGSSRPLFDIKIVAESLNFDTLMGGGEGAAKPAAGGDPLQGLKTLALPYDLKTDIVVNDATLQGHEIKGLKLAVVLTPNVLKIEKIGADNFVGSAISVQGAIGDLKNLAGLDIAATLNTPDPYKLAGAFKVDTQSWPKNLGAVKANVKAGGDLAKLDVNAAVNAMNGEVIFKGKVATPMTQPVLSQVALQLKHPNMTQALQQFGASAPQYKSFAGPVDLYTNVDMNGKVTSLSGIKATLAGSTLSGDLRYDAGAAIPALNGTLKFGKLVLQSAAKTAAQSAGGAGSGNISGGGKWSSAKLDTGWLRAMNADLNISAEQILYETWDLKNPALKFKIQGGTLDIANLQAGLFDGKIAAQAQLSAPAAESPLSLSTNAKIDNINMGALAQALSGTRQLQAEGDVSFNFDVKGSGSSQNALVNNLQGQAALQGRKVVMKGFDLAALATALLDSNKPLPRLQQLVEASTSGGQTAFDTVDGAYAITGGVINITSMAMDGPTASIVSTGNASLPRWYIDTTHKITLKNAREVAPFDVAIRGPLDNPANTFGKGMFESILRQKVQQKVMEKLPDVLGDDVSQKLQQFGILPQKQQPAPVAAPPEAEPASGDQSQEMLDSPPVPSAPPVEKTDDEKAQEAIQGLLKGLLQ